MINFKNYFARHIQAGMSSLGQLTRTPIASFMTCLVIGITLALPFALFVLLKNADNVRSGFQQTTQLTLYLKKNVSEAQANKLTSTLQNKTGIAKAYAISPEEGLVELQQQAGFQGVLEELHDNPLPWTIVIEPNVTEDTSDALTRIEQTLRILPEVDNVQVDMQWVERLGTFIALAKHIAFALAGFLSIAVLLIINNSIRSATQNNQKEIEVIKLIGGTNSFIRRPFLYAGLLYGLLGGIIAWLSVDVLLLIIHGPAHRLATLYHSSFTLAGLSLPETMILLFGSMVLGLIGSWLAVTRHLKS